MIIISDERVDLATPSGSMRTHIVRPAAPGRYPGIVFYSEIFQITAPIHRTACLLAGDGYDFGAIAHMECPIFRQHDGQEVCSEASVMLGQAGVYYGGLVPYETDPNKLYAACQRAGIVKGDL
mgnify:CR=1 FL=1